MIRSIKVSLNKSNTGKKEKFKEITDEYIRILNIFIKELAQHQGKLNKFASLKTDTWLSSRMQNNASCQAVDILKENRRKEEERCWKRLKRLKYKAIKSNKHLWIIDKKLNDFNIIYKSIPEVKNLSMELDYRFSDFKEDSIHFDSFIRLKSIGNKIFLKMPLLYHKRYNKYIKEGWIKKKSIRLKIKDNKINLYFYFEKETPNKKEKGIKLLGFDLGINKLITTNDGNKFGLKLKSLINELNNKKQYSKSWYKKHTEIKNYIDKTLNKLKKHIIDNRIDTIICEDLKNISINTKGKINKTVRKMLSKWNLNLFKSRLDDFIEVQGLHLVRVKPNYTSQTCPHCNNVNKENRHGEHFKCKSCGYTNDADIVGAINIANRFSRGESITDDIVPLSDEMNIA